MLAGMRNSVKLNYQNSGLSKSSGPFKKKINIITNTRNVGKDKIDIALQNYIKILDDRQVLKNNFEYESEGIYKFGRKRVFIKVENNDQLFVRVGGGYQHIDDFLKL